jgi:hypothetical protein
LHQYAFTDHDDEIWDKVGQPIGNLEALERLRIAAHNYLGNDNEDEDSPNPACERLARILSHVRQKFTVELLGNSDMWALGEMQALSGFIVASLSLLAMLDHANFSFAHVAAHLSVNKGCNISV